MAAELTRIKRNASDECLDTDDMVTEACDKVFGEGNWEAINYNEVVFCPQNSALHHNTN